jgi:hypothetical protein
MTTPLLILTVRGVPAGQGNLKGNGRGKLRHANSDELREWRDRVHGGALDVLGRHDFAGGPGRTRACVICGTGRRSHAELLGPVRLEAVVTVARPPSVATQWPTTRSSSDWDHYGRAISDALTGAVYADDSQVVDGRVVVSYPHVAEHALGEPGAVIRIWPVAP